MPLYLLERGDMFRIRRKRNGHLVLYLSGRIEADDLPDLKLLMDSQRESSAIVLDLSDLTLVDQAAIRFFGRLEQVEGIELANCPAYICDWIRNERNREHERTLPSSEKKTK
ncbi:MAG: hypothetical protein WCC27_22370 [Acidobacteriaceae bacterium]